MRAVVRGQWSMFRSCGLLSCLLLIANCLLLSCSVPNLEEQDCREARDVVREFYSFHFGNDMHPSADNVRLREKYLTSRLKDNLLNAPATDVDYFTATSDLPKAFRVGGCTVNAPGQSVNFDVLLFWKDDKRTEQKHISVAVRKENEKWLIDRVD
jgi:Protein of unknown function (DUF3828)